MTSAGDSQPLRIALLHPFDPAEVRRGTERLVGELARGLADTGHDVTLVTARRGPPREESREGYRVVINRRPPSPGFLGRHAMTYAPAARRTLRRANFDVVHAFHPTAALATLFRARRGASVVLTVPAFPPRDAGAVRRRILDRVFSSASRVVVPTQAVAVAVAQTHPGARAHLIPPGVDTARFSPSAGRAEEPTIFCAADPAEPRKRVDLLVAALELVRKEVPAARLVIADPYRGQRAQPRWLQGEGVEVRPVANDADLSAEYSAAWVTALPARDEPFGLVLTESMACGTPVLGQDDGGIPEVIGAGPQGHVVSGGVDEWSRALSEALRAPPSAEAADAARRRAGEFSMQRCVGEYEALYRILVATQTPTSGGGGG